MKWMFMVWVLLGAADSLAQTRSNPFSNPHMESGEDSTGRSGGTGFVLKAVMPSEHMALANIDGEILAVGETYEGYRIVEVTEEAVRLERGTASIQLFVSSTEREDEE